MVRQATRLKVGLAAVVLILVFYKLFHTSEPDWDSLEEENIQFGDFGGRVEVKEEQKFTKWIVVTTIQSPTAAIQKLASLRDWRVVVVGDRKTPKTWRFSGIVYIDTAAQKALKYRIHQYLPYDSYTRKMIGYLYAIEHGAQVIYETDDDNFIENMEIFQYYSSQRSLVVDTEEIAYNPYPHFGQSTLWPRGFPLEQIGKTQIRNYSLCPGSPPAIQQGLVNGDPDVDAIFRMTRKKDHGQDSIRFDNAAPAVVLPHGTFAPFNSQNTLYRYESLWALLLPTMVSDRATDIYRSYWAQKLLWLTGHNLGFFAPTGVQKRNAWHINSNDAKEEKDLYTEMGRYLEFLDKWSCPQMFFFDCVTELTKDLVMMGFWSNKDYKLVTAWVSDLASVRYAPPTLKTANHRKGYPCKTDEVSKFVYYPWEQYTTVAYSSNLQLSPDLTNFPFMKNLVEYICVDPVSTLYEKNLQFSPKMADVLLVVTIVESDVIPHLFATYSIHFPHILFCGSVDIKTEQLHKWKISYINIANSNPVRCVSYAGHLNYNVAGYLHVTQNIFLMYEQLHVSSRNKNQLWVTGLDLYIFKESITTLCREKQISCTNVNKESFAQMINKIKVINIQGDSFKETEAIIKCLNKVGSDPTLKTSLITTSKEIAFYIPQRLTATLDRILNIYMQDSMFERYDFVPVLLLECNETSTEYLHSTDLDDISSVKHYDYIFPFPFSTLLKTAKHVAHADSYRTKVVNEFCNYMKTYPVLNPNDSNLVIKDP